MFQVYFTNHFRYADQTFNDFDSALDYARSIGFDCVIYKGECSVASWSILGGLQTR